MWTVSITRSPYQHKKYIRFAENSLQLLGSSSKRKPKFLFDARIIYAKNSPKSQLKWLSGEFCLLRLKNELVLVVVLVLPVMPYMLYVIIVLKAVQQFAELCHILLAL